MQQLRERGVAFTITSGRPPFGMRMLVEPLGLTLPMAAFNGGAMGNAGDEVKQRATFVTTSFADEGFANAIGQILLPRASAASA